MAERTDKAWNALHDAVVRTERAADKGDVAKRNARRAFLSALRDLRTAVEVEYPTPRKAVGYRRKANPRQRLIERGYVETNSAGLLEYAGKARVRVYYLAGRRYVPQWLQWAWHAKLPIARVRELRASHKKRKAFVAHHALKHGRVLP